VIFVLGAVYRAAAARGRWSDNLSKIACARDIESQMSRPYSPRPPRPLLRASPLSIGVARGNPGPGTLSRTGWVCRAESSGDSPSRLRAAPGKDDTQRDIRRDRRFLLARRIGIRSLGGQLVRPGQKVRVGERLRLKGARSKQIGCQVVGLRRVWPASSAIRLSRAQAILLRLSGHRPRCRCRPIYGARTNHGL